MNDPFSLTGTITALVLPWLFGCVVLTSWLKTSSRWTTQIILGHGYLMGLFLTTLIIRAWDMIGLPLHFWSITLLIALLTTGIYAGARSRREVAQRPVINPPDQSWQRIITWLLVFLILYRYCGLAMEIWLRPLYPWDAWMNWAPKAVVWFHLGELAAFISPKQWLEKFGDLQTYTTGAENAWKYPVTVPLIQLWGMLGAGASDQNYSNLPWLLAPLAFALALYGHLRRLGGSALLATSACYILLSIPYLGVHSVLSGYADLWLALAFGAAIMALHEWQLSRHWSWGALTLVFAFGCTQLKLPGVVLGGIVLAVFVVSLINPGRKTILFATILMIPLLMYIICAGISLDIPAVGHLEVSTSRIAAPHIGTFNLNYHPVHAALATSLFSLSNWNIFWYLFVALLVIKVLKGEVFMAPSVEFQCIALAFLFFSFVFYFTHIHQYVLDFTTVNRAILYVIPVSVFYAFKYLCQPNPAETKSAGFDIAS
jgi:hypothetical protein